jgi:hypothetical protein
MTLRLLYVRLITEVTDPVTLKTCRRSNCKLSTEGEWVTTDAYEALVCQDMVALDLCYIS